MYVVMHHNTVQSFFFFVCFLEYYSLLSLNITFVDTPLPPPPHRCLWSEKSLFRNECNSSKNKSIQTIITFWRPVCTQWNMYTTEGAWQWPRRSIMPLFKHFTFHTRTDSKCDSIDSIVSGSLAIPQHGKIHFPSHNELSFYGWSELNRLCIWSRQI